MTASRTHEEDVSRRVREHRGLVEFAVNRFLKRYPLVGIERDDLVSWGLMGLYHAARTWDAGRGLAFSTLAVKVIERMVVRGIRAERRGARPAVTMSLDALLGEGEDGAGERHLDQLVDEGETIEEQILRLDLQLTIRQEIAELSPEQQWVVKQRYYRRRTLREIAAETGTSRQAVHLREQTILRALRRRLSEAA
jgi:RNA polymerase sporulation-specific sigma factor